MIKIKIGLLRDEQFHMSLAKLCAFPFSDTKTLYNLKRIREKIRQEIAHTQELYMDILKETSEFYNDEQGQQKFKVKPDMETIHKTKMLNFSETEIEIDRNQLDCNLVFEAKLNATDLDVLEPLLTDLDILDKGATVSPLKPA